MIKKFQLGKDILSLIIFTLITVLTWVSFEVWVSATKSTIPKATEEQMTVLNPNISKEVLESLKKKISLSEEELNKSVIDSLTASISAENKATESGLKTTESNQENNATGSSQKATESGILE